MEFALRYRLVQGTREELCEGRSDGHGRLGAVAGWGSGSPEMGEAPPVTARAAKARSSAGRPRLGAAV